MKKLTTALIALAAISTPVVAEEYGVYNDQAPFPVTVDWNGFYAGVIAGGGGGNGTANRTTIPVFGGTLGLRAGFDAQFDHIVVGAALTVEGSNIEGSATCFDPAFTCQGGAQALGRLEGRVGFASDAALVYAKGGAVYAYQFGDSDPTYNDYYFGSWGWTVGAGAEVALTDNVSVFAEYNYIDLLEHTVAAGVINGSATRITSAVHLVNAGMNYRF